MEVLAEFIAAENEQDVCTKTVSIKLKSGIALPFSVWTLSGKKGVHANPCTGITGAQ